MGTDFEEFLSRMGEWEEEGLLPEWARDRQARSRATRARILAAAESLVGEHPYPGVSLADIARRAGVSVGAVYARFPSKEAILLMLGVAVFDEVCRRFEEALSSLPEAPLSFRDVVAAYVTTLVRELVRHRALITEVRRHAATDPSLRRLADRTNRAIHETFLTRARAFSHRIRHPDPEARLNYALFAVNAAAREAILSGALGTYSVKGGNTELTVELTTLMTRYVAAEE